MSRGLGNAFDFVPPRPIKYASVRIGLPAQNVWFLRGIVIINITATTPFYYLFTISQPVDHSLGVCDVPALHGCIPTNPLYHHSFRGICSSAMLITVERPLLNGGKSIFGLLLADLLDQVDHDSNT